MLTQGLPRRRGRIPGLAFRLVPSLVLLAAAAQPAAATGTQATEAQATGAQATVTQAAATPAGAGAPLRVELNKLETAGDTCKAVMIVENGKGGAIKSLRLDLYAFDTDGVVQKRSMVELGPVPARKTALRQFEIAPPPAPRSAACCSTTWRPARGTT